MHSPQVAREAVNKVGQHLHFAMAVAADEGKETCLSNQGPGE